LDKLIQLFTKMEALTRSECEVCTHECRQAKYRCCTGERKYCEIARQYAKKYYNIELKETGNPDLPFMGEQGCTVPPHLRPICTIHLCTISYAPKAEIPGNEEKTKEYFQLRDEILAEVKSQEKELAN
jgi:hypothetical protein